MTTQKLVNPSKPATFFARALAMFENQDYRRLLVSNVLLWQAMMMETVALGWLVLEMTNSPWLVSLVSFCRTAPFPICGLLAGPITDRLGRRRVLLMAQSANLLIYTTITVLLWTGQLTVWQLMASALVLGAAWALDWPARSALIPDLVGKARVVDATLSITLTQNLARVLGPAAAGATLAIGGAFGCYLVIAVLAALCWFNLRQLTRQPVERTVMPATTTPWQLITEGLRYVGRNQTILAVMLITLVINLLYFPYLTLLSVFARDVLQRGPVELGILGAASGIGSFLGLFLVARWQRRASNGMIFIVGTLAMLLLLLAFAGSTNYVVSCVLLLLGGMGEACFVIMQSSIILLAASDTMRSRVLGTLMLAIGIDPVGKLQTGLLVDRFGAQIALASQAGIAFLSVIAIVVALPALRRPTATERQTAEPAANP